MRFDALVTNRGRQGPKCAGIIQDSRVRFMEFHEAKAKPLFNLQNNPSANHAIAPERKGWEGGRKGEKRVCVVYQPIFCEAERKLIFGSTARSA